MIRLIRLARGQHVRLAVALLIVLLSSGGMLAYPLVAKAVLDALQAGEPVGHRIGLLCVVVVAVAALKYIGSLLLGWAGEALVLQLRAAATWRLLNLGVAELDKNPPADLIARVTADTAAVRSAATSGVVGLTSGVLGVLGALVLMALLSPVLLLVTMLSLLALVPVSVLLMPRIRIASRRVQDAVGRIGTCLDRALGAARTIKASNRQEEEVERVLAASRSAAEAGRAGAKYNAVITALTDFTLQSALLIVLGVGGALVASGTEELSTLIAFLLYLFSLTSPLGSAMSALGAIHQGVGAAERVHNISSLQLEDDSTVQKRISGALSHATGTPRCRGRRVEFDGVCFTYPGRDVAALHQVTFTIDAGTQTAIVGPSGAGKTTLFELLMRFREPSIGRIRLDGVPIDTVSRERLREIVAYVEQSPTLLDGTLRDNLTYALARDVGDEELGMVCKATRLDDLISRVPDGLDSWVGSRGVVLSGGERQRVAIAHALLRKPEVLLLDEATASLDALSERALIGVIDEIRETKACTVVVIAHRLATIQTSDQILVLDGGTICASGDHRSLTADGSLYAEMVQGQTLVDARVRVYTGGGEL